MYIPLTILIQVVGWTRSGDRVTILFREEHGIVSPAGSRIVVAEPDVNGPLFGSGHLPFERRVDGFVTRAFVFATGHVSVLPRPELWTNVN